jgi:hypothetical protein
MRAASISRRLPLTFTDDSDIRAARHAPVAFVRDDGHDPGLAAVRRLTEVVMFPFRTAFVAVIALVVLAVVGPVQALTSAGAPSSGRAYAPARIRHTPTPPPSPSPTPTPAPVPWRVVASPNPDQFNNTLSAVAAVSASDVWAVGQTGVSTLAEHWDGTAWSVVPTPNPATTGAAQNALLALAAVATNDVWAVGYSITSSYATLAMHWDGSRWTVVPTPNPPTRDFNVGVAANRTNVLRAIAGVRNLDLWAVGSSSDGAGHTLTLIEHYTG